MALSESGMATRDISDQIKNLYDVHISANMVSNITNRILPVVTEWQNRPLKILIHLCLWIPYTIRFRDDKHVVVKAAYVVLGVNIHGEKEVLVIWISANKGSKFWLPVLNHLKNRDVDDVLIFCVDGLSGFKFVRPVICRQLPSDSISRWTPLS